MRNSFKTLALAGAVTLGLLVSSSPAFAQSECAPYITSGRNDQPVMGELLGTKLVRIRVGGGGFGYEGSYEESVYYGYYRFTGSEVWSEWRNCATYEAATLLP